MFKQNADQLRVLVHFLAGLTLELLTSSHSTVLSLVPIHCIFCGMQLPIQAWDTCFWYQFPYVCKSFGFDSFYCYVTSFESVWSIYPHYSGLLHRYCGHYGIVPRVYGWNGRIPNGNKILHSVNRAHISWDTSYVFTLGAQSSPWRCHSWGQSWINTETKCSPLAEIVILIIFSATNDDNFVRTMTFPVLVYRSLFVWYV